MLNTFRFYEIDHVSYDLMEGSVWPGLQQHFLETYGIATSAEVLDHLDTDFRWIGMRYLDQKSAAPPPSETSGTMSKVVADGPLSGAMGVSEIAAHSWPDPSRWVPADYKSAREQWPDHALVFMAGWCPLFWGTCEAFGVEAALTNMLSSPFLFEAAVQNIHDRYMDRLIRGLKSAQGYCDICWLGDDFSSQQSMFISPEHWRHFIKPYLAKQVRLAREHGMFVLYHSCGSVRPVLADLIDIGVNALLVFQTSARGMDAGSIAEEFGGRMAFYGGMDVQQLLSFGTALEVEARVRENVRKFADTGGYIVANSHHRVATITGANIEVMCRTARATTTGG